MSDTWSRALDGLRQLESEFGLGYQEILPGRADGWAIEQAYPARGAYWFRNSEGTPRPVDMALTSVRPRAGDYCPLTGQQQEDYYKYFHPRVYSGNI